MHTHTYQHITCTCAPKHIYIYIYIIILEWTRALNAREVSWRRAKGLWAQWLRKTFCQCVVSSCLWSCLLCLECTCVFSPWLLCSYLLLCRMFVSPDPFWSLSWVSFGANVGLPESHFGAPGGPWGSRPPVGPSRAAPGQPLGRSWETLGAPCRRSWRLLGRSWPAPGLPPASLGPSWRLLWPPLGRLGRLLAAESEFSRNLVKNMCCFVFAWFRVFWGPLGAPWAPLGGSWVLLGRPKWLLGGFWGALAPAQEGARIAAVTKPPRHRTRFLFR